MYPKGVDVDSDFTSFMSHKNLFYFTVTVCNLDMCATLILNIQNKMQNGTKNKLLRKFKMLTWKLRMDMCRTG